MNEKNLFSNYSMKGFAKFGCCCLAGFLMWIDVAYTHSENMHVFLYIYSVLAFLCGS